MSKGLLRIILGTLGFYCIFSQFEHFTVTNVSLTILGVSIVSFSQLFLQDEK